MEKKKKLSDKVISELLDLITVQKVYKPGDKLPNEQELSVQLGISRTTLREAILYLVAQDVLEIRRGKGTYVCEHSDIHDDFGFNSLSYMDLKLRDLYEIRACLEPQLAYYAAERATDKELQEIYAIGERLIESAKSRDENAEENRRFHVAVAKAAHNQFSISLTEIINDALVKAFKEKNMKQTLSYNSLLDHRMIMEYLRMRDGEGAKQAMNLHIQHAMKEFDMDK